jgi:hypothetical protein
MFLGLHLVSTLPIKLQGTLEKTKEAKEVLQGELHQRDIVIESGKYNVELQIENR